MNTVYHRTSSAIYRIRLYSIDTDKMVMFACRILPSPIFLYRPMAFFLLLEPWDVRELYIRKTADLPLQLLVGTFPRFVAIRFYFLSENLI